MKQQEAWKEERERGISKMIGLLKFITCGSVDDGKSTLIGHILYDSKLLYTDQEEALELDSKVGSRGGTVKTSHQLKTFRLLYQQFHSLPCQWFIVYNNTIHNVIHKVTIYRFSFSICFNS